MAVPALNRRVPRRFVTLALAVSSAVMAACGGSDSSAPAAPHVPGGDTPASNFRPNAFVADVNIRTGDVKISAPTTGTRDNASLSLAGGKKGPDLSLLGGEAVRLIPSNFHSSAVGQFTPGKIRVTFDVVIENKLPGIKFITPTWPTAPAPGVILFPLEEAVTTTPGGVTGGDGEDIIVELPSNGSIAPSTDWNGTGAAGSGAPFNFFNDADCSVATSNDCFRWEAYDTEIQPAPATSSVRTIGFDIDPTVGQFRARMVVAADLAAAGTVVPGTISGAVTSPTRGALTGVHVDVSGGLQGTTDAAGAYSVTGVAVGTRTVTLSALPSGCTAPAAQTVGVAAGSTNTVDFTVTCTGQPGTVGGVVRRSNDNSVLTGVTVTASTGGSAVSDAAGAYSIANVASGSGTLAVTNIPAECSPTSTPYTLPSNGNVTVDITVTCTVAQAPKYKYTVTWVDLGNNQVAADLRIDMRTLNRADITDVTTGTDTGDPLTGAQLSFTYDASKLTYNDGIGTSSPNITAAPTVNGGTPGTVSILNGATTLKTGNVGIARIIFDRVAGATGTVGTTTTLTAVSSRTGGNTINILADVVNNEGTFTLP